jgi:hypothetical protein
MARSCFRPQVSQLEDRCTPSSFSFSAGIGGGHSAVRLLVQVYIPTEPLMPEVVTLTKFLPNGTSMMFPPTAMKIPMNALKANIPMHDLFIPPEPIIPQEPFLPGDSILGLLEAAHINSSMFIPHEGGGHG